MIKWLWLAWPEILKDIWYIDIGKTGYISVEELRKLLDNYKIYIREVILDQVIEMCRKQSLWKINYYEFEKYLELNEEELNEKQEEFFITSDSTL